MAVEQGSQQSGNSDGGIWVFVVSMIALWLLITFKIEIFSIPIAYVRLFELNILLHIPFMPESTLNELEYYKSILLAVQINPHNVDSNKLFLLNNLSSRISSFFFIFAISYMAYKVFVYKRFNKVHSMKSLLKEQGLYWGRTAMFSTHKVDTKNIYDGDWAISTKPHHYALKNKFWDKVTGDFFVDRAKSVLIKQLGNPLTKSKKKITNISFVAKKWPDYARYALAILLLRLQVNAIADAKLQVLRSQNEIELEKSVVDNLKLIAKGDSDKFNKESEALIKAIGIAYAFDEFTDVKRSADSIIKKYGKTDIILDVANRHKYYYTFFAGALDTTREVGVLASADFLWIKKYDRRLWYTINNVGRRVGWAEVSGIWSHYIAEKSKKEKLDTPHVDGAIEGFKRFLAPKE